MIITPIEHGLILNAPAPGYVRSPGLHMSAIYGDLYAKLEPKRYGGTDGPDPLRMELGSAFEEILEIGLKNRLSIAGEVAGGERPGEFETEEGIAFSPDLLFWEGDKLIVGEIKLTWMSSADFPREPGGTLPPRASKWDCQMMSYAKHLGTIYGRLYAFFVNGDYRPPKPELLAWDIVWSQREIDDNWSGMKNHALHVGLLPIKEKE